MSQQPSVPSLLHRRHARTRNAGACGLALLLACSSPDSNPQAEPARKGVAAPGKSLPYLGQPAPGQTPQSFAPGIVNTDAIELNAVFTPDGEGFFFTRKVDGVLTMFECRLEQGAWSSPRPLDPFPQPANATAVDMSISPDGEQLCFTGACVHPFASGEPGLDLWLMQREGRAWTHAAVVPPPVSTQFNEIYPVLVSDGSLYFNSNRPGGIGASNLYRAQRLQDGSFGEPQLLPRPINDEAGIGDCCVEPAERWMVFSSRRTPSAGRGDLFASFRGTDGAWSEPRSLGPLINSAEHEYCPMLSPDGRFLFFSRRYGETWETTTGGDVFWVDANVIERLR